MNINDYVDFRDIILHNEDNLMFSNLVSYDVHHNPFLVCAYVIEYIMCGIDMMAVHAYLSLL